MIRIRETMATRAGYDAWARQYDDEDNALILVDNRVVPTLLPELAGRRVLDVGCGTGRISLAMAAAGAAVTAIDFSPEMLVRARAKADEAGLSIKFIEGDANQGLPVAASSFDVVTSFLVTDHVRDLAAFFAELKRVCRPGGEIVVTTVHPAMHLKGVIARFMDPATGERVQIESVEHEICDYVNAAVRAGLEIVKLQEHRVDGDIVKQSPRAEKYRDWPIHLSLQCKC